MICDEAVRGEPERSWPLDRTGLFRVGWRQNSWREEFNDESPAESVALRQNVDRPQADLIAGILNRYTGSTRDSLLRWLRGLLLNASLREELAQDEGVLFLLTPRDGTGSFYEDWNDLPDLVATLRWDPERGLFDFVIQGQIDSSEFVFRIRDEMLKESTVAQSSAQNLSFRWPEGVIAYPQGKVFRVSHITLYDILSSAYRDQLESRQVNIEDLLKEGASKIIGPSGPQWEFLYQHSSSVDPELRTLVLVNVPQQHEVVVTAPKMVSGYSPSIEGGLLLRLPGSLSLDQNVRNDSFKLIQAGVHSWPAVGHQRLWLPVQKRSSSEPNNVLYGFYRIEGDLSFPEVKFIETGSSPVVGGVYMPIESDQTGALVVAFKDSDGFGLSLYRDKTQTSSRYLSWFRNLPDYNESGISGVSQSITSYGLSSEPTFMDMTPRGTLIVADHSGILVRQTEGPGESVTTHGTYTEWHSYSSLGSNVRVLAISPDKRWLLIVSQEDFDQGKFFLMGINEEGQSVDTPLFVGEAGWGSQSAGFLSQNGRFWVAFNERTSFRVKYFNLKRDNNRQGVSVALRTDRIYKRKSRLSSFNVDTYGIPLNGIRPGLVSTQEIRPRQTQREPERSVLRSNFSSFWTDFSFDKNKHQMTIASVSSEPSSRRRVNSVGQQPISSVVITKQGILIWIQKDPSRSAFSRVYSLDLNNLQSVPQVVGSLIRPFSELWGTDLTSDPEGKWCVVSGVDLTWMLTTQDLDNSCFEYLIYRIDSNRNLNLIHRYIDGDPRSPFFLRGPTRFQFVPSVSADGYLVFSYGFLKHDSDLNSSESSVVMNVLDLSSLSEQTKPLKIKIPERIFPRPSSEMEPFQIYKSFSSQIFPKRKILGVLNSASGFVYRLTHEFTGYFVDIDFDASIAAKHYVPYSGFSGNSLTVSKFGYFLGSSRGEVFFSYGTDLGRGVVPQVLVRPSR